MTVYADYSGPWRVYTDDDYPRERVKEFENPFPLRFVGALIEEVRDGLESRRLPGSTVG